MTYSSNTKSWESCNLEERRACKALAAFTKVKEMLGAKELEDVLPPGELKEAINGFKWATNQYGRPQGRSEKEVGIPDNVLDKLFDTVKAAPLLTSWLQKGDKAWKRAIDPEISKRKKEVAKLKKIDPKSSKVRYLEGEIKKLEKDWTL